MRRTRHPWLLGFASMLLIGCGGASPAPASPAAGSPSNEETSTAVHGTSDPVTAEHSRPATPHASGDASEPEPEPAKDPYADMPHPQESDSGRHQLAADDVKALVKAYRPHMRELCWIPRVNETPSGPDTVRVAVEVEVTKQGEVRSVRAVGGKQYQGLADCVKEHVTRWRFPSAGQDSSLMFPILFERGESKLIRVE